MYSIKPFKLHRFISFIALYLLPHGAFAACGIPTDQNGDTIPNLAGNIPYLKMPDALCADNGEYTWDYSGTLQDAQKRYSFQSTIMQFSSNGQVGVGMHLLDFAFKQDGAWFYSDSTYGGENNAAQAVAQSLDAITSSASLTHFSVTSTLLANSRYQWQFSNQTTTPVAPLYQGYVGQPGQSYLLTGTGTTYLWRYDQKSNQPSAQPYQYTFSVTVLDTRGTTMEGLGGGYVGPKLIPMQPSGVSYNVESEVAQPRLKVQNWRITFTAIGKIAPGYQNTYSRSGEKGMLWNDFGPVDKGGKTAPEKNRLLSSLTKNNTQALNAIGHGAKGLYNGNWLPVTFTKGKYKGASVVFFIFWNHGAPYSAGQSTSNLQYSEYGWANFFSGFTKNNISSAFSTIETLYPENPGAPALGTTEKPPYKIVFNQYESTQYHLAAPWVSQLTITIKANTPLRYAFAAYANARANSTSADDPSQDLIIHVKRISPITENTLFSNQITQYYEGAAIPTVNGKRVGYAWIEQMRNS